jgi:NifU-like protein involved in Fe-S cluster formation
MGLSTTVLGEIGEKKNKQVQFVVIFYLLREDRLMTNYESFKDLVYFFEIKNMPKKHRSNNLGWDITKSMHNVVS